MPTYLCWLFDLLVSRSVVAATVSDGTGLDWTGLDWTGLDWTVVKVIEYKSSSVNSEQTSYVAGVASPPHDTYKQPANLTTAHDSKTG